MVTEINQMIYQDYVLRFPHQFDLAANEVYDNDSAMLQPVTVVDLG